MTRPIAVLRDAAWLDAARLKRLAIVAAVFVVGAVAIDAWLHTRAGVVNGGGEQLGRDFVNYWAGGKLAAAGHAARAYDIPAFWGFERGLTAPNAEFKLYSYPPTALLWSLPLGLLPYVAGWLVWTLAGVAGAAAVLRDRLSWRWALAAAVAAPALLLNAIAGQNGGITAALFAGGILLLDRRPWLAGVLIGLLGCKPQLGVLIPFALVAGGRWRTAAAAAATVILNALAAGALLGWDAWSGFLHAMPLHRRMLEENPGIWRRIPTVFVMVRELSGPVALAYAAQAASALGAASVVVAVWRSGASTRLKGAALMIATFLATPYAWDYDMVMLTAAAAWIWAEAETSGWRPYEKTAVALMVAAPAVTPGIVAATHLQLGVPVLWLALAMVARRVLAEEKRPSRLWSSQTKRGRPKATPDHGYGGA